MRTAEALAGKVVGIYFSGDWCPPCRGFTPILVQAYDNVSRRLTRPSAPRPKRRHRRASTAFDSNGRVTSLLGVGVGSGGVSGEGSSLSPGGASAGAVSSPGSIGGSVGGSEGSEEETRGFEVVFVSSDRDQTAFEAQSRVSNKQVVE